MALTAHGSGVLLVDTSAWVETFRRLPSITLDEIIDDRNLIIICLPVIQEVLQDFDDEWAFAIASDTMGPRYLVSTRPCRVTSSVKPWMCIGRLDVPA